MHPIKERKINEEISFIDMEADKIVEYYFERPAFQSEIEEVLRKQEKLTLEASKELEEKISCLLPHFKTLKYLDLSGVPWIKDEHVSLVLNNNCVTLNALNLSNCKNLTFEGVGEAIFRCVHLQRFECRYTNFANFIFFSSFYKHIQNLEYLDVCGFTILPVIRFTCLFQANLKILLCTGLEGKEQKFTNHPDIYHFLKLNHSQNHVHFYDYFRKKL